MRHSIRGLAITSTGRPLSNLSQCHGLSGLGEIYLEAARVLGEDVWCDRAAQIGEVILELGHEEIPLFPG